MSEKSSKIYKPRTYKRKITALEKIIAVQNNTIAAKDKTIKSQKESMLIKDAAYEAEKKHRKDAELSEYHALKLAKIEMTRANRGIVHFARMRDKSKKAEAQKNDAEQRCEELADRNLELQEEIDAANAEIKELREEIEQKEKITEGEYEEDKPN